MSIKQGDEVEVTLTIQGQTKIGTLIGEVFSVANRDIGIRFPNEEGEWKVDRTAIRPFGQHKWKLTAQVSTDPAKLS
jgi:hypothetical protein